MTTQVHQPSALVSFARDIKLSHSVFAMPFALLSSFLAAGGVPKMSLLLLVVVCMVLARSFAMGMNRLLDARLDALNPRTASRAIPAGRLSKAQATRIVVGCGLLFVATTSLFYFVDGNTWPLMLSGPALAFVGVYPLFKRLTALVHFWLGAALGLAPLCAWVAVAGMPTSWLPALLGVAVMCWTAGFDIIYGTQDHQSDLATGVRSMPVRVGIASSLWIARLTHVVALGLFGVCGLMSPQLHLIWFSALCVVAILLLLEHVSVKATDLSKVNLAFFTLNGVIALVLGTCGVLDVVF